MSKLIPIDLNGDRNFKGNLYDKKEVDAQLEQLQARVAEDELKIKLLQGKIKSLESELHTLKQALAAREPVSCKECGSTANKWHWNIINKSSAIDGRLCGHDMGVIFYLGCEECSETLKTYSGDRVAEILNSLSLPVPTA